MLSAHPYQLAIGSVHRLCHAWRLSAHFLLGECPLAWWRRVNWTVSRWSCDRMPVGDWLGDAGRAGRAGGRLPEHLSTDGGDGSTSWWVCHYRQTGSLFRLDGERVKCRTYQKTGVGETCHYNKPSGAYHNVIVQGTVTRKNYRLKQPSL